MNDAFKKVTAAIEGDPVLNEICKLAFQAGAEDAREQMKAEVEALRKACNDRVRAALEEAADIAGEFDTGIAGCIRRFIHVEAARPGERG